MKKVLAGLAVLVLSGAVLAQPGRPGGQQRDGGRQGGRVRVPGMNMMDRPLTLSLTPAPTLKAVLKLTADQEKKISAIQEKAGQDIRGLFPRAERGQRPDQKAIRAAMPKFEARMKQADAEISAVLTPAQRKLVPAMLKEMHALRGAGLPMSLAGSLKLTAAQLTKLEAIGKARNEKQRKAFESARQGGDPRQAMQQWGQFRETARKDAMAVLNAQQKAAVEKWEREHPRRQFGGPGMGGLGMGGPGGRMGAGGAPGGRQGRPGQPGAGGGRRGAGPQ